MAASPPNFANIFIRYEYLSHFLTESFALSIIKIEGNFSLRPPLLPFYHCKGSENVCKNPPFLIWMRWWSKNVQFYLYVSPQHRLQLHFLSVSKQKNSYGTLILFPIPTWIIKEKLNSLIYIIAKAIRSKQIKTSLI